MKWKLSPPEPAMLVYYFAKLAGLAQFTIRNNRFYPQTSGGKLWSVLLAVTCFLIFPVMIISAYEDLTLPKNPSELGIIIDKFRQFISSVSTFLPLMIFLFMDKRMLYILEKLRDISDELKNLGIEEDRKKFFKNLFVTVVIVNLIVLASSVLTFFVIPSCPVSILIKFSLDIWLKSNIILMFTQTLLFLKKRFKLLNNELNDLIKPAGNLRSRDNSRLSAEEGRDLANFHRLRKIELLHLEHCDLVYRTTQLLEVSIFLTILQYTTELMIVTFRMYFVYRDLNQILNIEGIVSYAISVKSELIEVIMIVVHLTSVAYASASVCREGNAAKEALCKVSSGTKSPELEEEFFMFSLQLKQKPVKVSAFGFFDLGYSYLNKIFSAVVAYLVVMIQLDRAQSHSG